jgi:hypothetical protein
MAGFPVEWARKSGLEAREKRMGVVLCQGKGMPRQSRLDLHSEGWRPESEIRKLRSDLGANFGFEGRQQLYDFSAVWFRNSLVLAAARMKGISEPPH